MFISARAFRLGAFAIFMCTSVAWSAPQVTLSMRTTSGDSILSADEDIIWSLDAQGHEIEGVSLPMYVYYTNGNLLGPLRANRNVIASARTIGAFESISLNNPVYGCDAPAPFDSILVGLVNFNSPGWTGAGELFRIVTGPPDTGTITFMVAILPPASWMAIWTRDSGAAVVTWDVPTIVVDPALASGFGAVPSFRIRTHLGNDTLFAGGPSQLIISVDPRNLEITELTFPGVIQFSNGNVIGPLPYDGAFEPTPLASSTFEILAWSDSYGRAATDPDTILLLLGDFQDTVGLSTAGDLARLSFTPLDTGTFTIDTALIPTSHQLGWSFDQCGDRLDFNWQPLTVHVVPCPVLMGDCNEDGTVTSADIIWYVNYMFKSGPEPLPMRTVGDVNCSGGLSGADIIYLVNYFFKSGPAPCGCYVRVI